MTSVRFFFLEPSRVRAYFMLAIAVFLNLAFLTKLHRDWWFEDDPNLVVFVEDHPRPLDYFFDRETILRLSPSRTLTPMQALSFKLDHWLSPRDSGFAYLHSALALLLATLLFFETLWRFLPGAHALAAATLWTFLPSTLAVVEFLSARHYLEGFIWLNLSMLAALRGEGARPIERPFWVPISILAWGLAALSKEIFVTTGFLSLVWVFARSRQFGALIASTAALALYFGYRIWAIGLIGEGFDSSWAFLARYWEFLWRLPVVATGNSLGYAVVPGLIALVLYLSLRGQITRVHWLFWSVQLAVLACTVLPVTQQLSDGYRAPGPWFRVAFLLNGFLLAGAFWVFSRCPRPTVNWSLGALLAVALVAGARGAAIHWDALKQPYRRDGEFYRQHPDKLLFTQLPAFFIDGIHNLYNRDRPTHYIAAQRLSPTIPRDLNRFSEIWVHGHGGFAPDKGLRAKIARNFGAGILPLDLETGPAPADMVSSPGPEAEPAVYRDGLLVFPSGSNGQAPHTIPVPWSRATEFEILFPPLQGRPSPRPGLFLANDGDSGARCSLSGFDREGNFLFSLEKHLEPGGFFFSEIEELWPGNQLHAIARVSVRSGHPLLGGSLFRNAFEEPQFLAPAYAPRKGPKFLAHIPKPPWRVGLLLCNPAPTAADVVVTSYPEGGGEPGLATVRLVPGSTVYWAFSDGHAASFESGSAAVTALALMGNAVDDRWSGYQPNAALAKRLTDPRAVRGGEGRPPAWKGLAFFNPNDRVATILAISETGAVRETWKVPGQGKITRTIPAETLSIPEYRADLPLVGIGLQTLFWGGLTLWELIPSDEDGHQTR